MRNVLELLLAKLRVVGVINRMIGWAQEVVVVFCVRLVQQLQRRGGLLLLRLVFLVA